MGFSMDTTRVPFPKTSHSDLQKPWSVFFRIQRKSERTASRAIICLILLCALLYTNHKLNPNDYWKINSQIFNILKAYNCPLKSHDLLTYRVYFLFLYDKHVCTMKSVEINKIIEFCTGDCEGRWNFPYIPKWMLQKLKNIYKDMWLQIQ